MPNSIPPNDENFLLALSDVVWRFHVYEQYGKKQDKAIKALARRIPGYSPEVYKEMFELNLRLLIATIEAIKEAPIQPGQKYEKVWELITEYSIRKLRTLFPGQTDEFLKDHLGMAIHWFIMR